MSLSPYAPRPLRASEAPPPDPIRPPIPPELPASPDPPDIPLTPMPQPPPGDQPVASGWFRGEPPGPFRGSSGQLGRRNTEGRHR